MVPSDYKVRLVLVMLYKLSQLLMKVKQPTKKQKVEKVPAPVPETNTVNKIMIELKNSLKLSIGTFQLPTSVTPKELQVLVNTVLKEMDKTQLGDFNDSQYTFFHGEKEIKTQLEYFLKNYNIMAEETFHIIFHPIAQYKVKPITRSSTSMFGHTESVLCAAFSPDSLKLVTGSGDTTVRLWDLATETPLKEVKNADWVMVVAWAPDGSKFAFGQNNGNVSVYNLENQSLVKMKGHTKWIMSICWEPLHLNSKCQHLVSASKDASLRLWNVDSGTCLRSFGNHTRSVTKVVWGGDSTIYSCSQDLSIKAWTSAGHLKHQLKKHSHWVNTMSLSTEHTLKNGCYHNNEPVPETEEKKKNKALQLYENSIKYHKERLVTGSDDLTMMLFELPCKEPLIRMTGHKQPICHVQFSPDGRYIVSGSFDKSLKLWDGYNGNFMFSFMGHVGAVYNVAWSCDSMYFVSASKDSTMKVWDIKTRKLREDLPGHADEVYCVDWSVDGQKVASGGKDRQVKIWKN